MQNYMADPFPNEFFFPNANSMVKTKIIPLSILYSYIYIVIFWILRFSHVPSIHQRRSPRMSGCGSGKVG
jgi:hypothetical protein